MTLLFIPGFMADRTLWGEVVAALDPREEVAFADLDQGDSIEDMARRVLEHAPENFDLVAFSMGGYVARTMARRAPERVKSLVLIATSARADTVEQIRQKATAVAQLSSATAFRGLSRCAILASLHPDRSGNPALLERVRAMGERLGREVFLRQSSLPRASDIDTLFLIRCPTLVIAARDDRLRSLDEALELKEGIPGAQGIIIERSGHMVPLEAPEALAGAIRAWRPT